jgi:hypothetical protein
MEEADHGQERGILVPALLDPVEPPIGFRSIQAADLITWQPERPSTRFEQLVQDINIVLERGPLEPLAAERAAEPKTKIREQLPVPPQPQPKVTLRHLTYALFVVVLVLVSGRIYWKDWKRDKNTSFYTSTEQHSGNGIANIESDTTELPYFMTRLVTENDLKGKSNWELDIMRNEIYARHGRRFSRTDLQNHFDNQKWYVPEFSPDGFPTSLLTELQRKNAVFIRHYQQRP